MRRPLLLIALLLFAARADAQTTDPCTAPNVDVQNPTTIAIRAPDLALVTVNGVIFSAAVRANNTIVTIVTVPKAAFTLAPSTTDCYVTGIGITPLFARNGTLYELTARLTGASADSTTSPKSNGFNFTSPPPTAPTAVRVSQ